MKIKQAVIGCNLLILLFVAACTTDAAKKKTPDLKTDVASVANAPTAEGDQSALVRMLLKSHHIYPFYIRLSKDSTGIYFVLFQEFADKKASKNLYFSSEEKLQLYAAKVRLTGDKEVRVISKALILEEESTYCVIDSNINEVTVAGRKYASLTYDKEFMGTAITEKFIDFQLIDLNSLEHYTLDFAGHHSWKCEDCLEGELVNKKALKGKGDILSFLEGMALKSPRIYHPSEKDKDPYHVINYEVKWEKDNNASNHMANGHGELDVPLKSTYYRTNLFNLQQGSEFETAENEQYLFKSYFCGSVIGFDKQRKLYFPLMIEDCNAMCSKKLSINAEGVLKLSYEEDDFYEVPLKELIFDKQKEK
ncbi:hypothetical protein SAMN05421820_10742 [Pedobacter steynii]|uniref:Lipoprotein n=1 Tax=Pedobacter steynii TaxID=430522 RepID=A0A1H0AC15_9SPHI|nr:hypothetical protein [Pedobacter steynii]NQX41415.1 hypothetical protein [Pedobacter steynii]SDN30523.1 hypothetical protein SAMN05421820_10742 [Pedobacter steynii]